METFSEGFIVSDLTYFAGLFIGAFFFFYILPRLVNKFGETKNAANSKK